MNYLIGPEKHIKFLELKSKIALIGKIFKVLEFIYYLVRMKREKTKFILVRPNQF